MTVEKKKIVISGGTGFIGRALCNRLNNDYELIIVTRNVERAIKKLGVNVTYVESNHDLNKELIDHLKNTYAVINLSGAKIAGKRWTNQRKRNIINSRVKTIEMLIHAIEQSPYKPEIFMQASAIGYYENSLDHIWNEHSDSSATTFTNKVLQMTEEAAQKATSLGMTLIITRLGLVLGSNDGILPRLKQPFQFGFGGHLGNGEHWMSWIHIEDVVEAIFFLLKREHARGVYNLTSPKPVKAKHFSSLIGKHMHSGSWFHVPGWLLRWVFGEQTDEVLIASQRVIPSRLSGEGFMFKYEDLNKALDNLITMKNKQKIR